MFLKILLTLFLTPQILLPAVWAESGYVLGIKTERQDSEVGLIGPQRIVNQNLDLVLSSKSALAVDLESGKILFEKNINDVRPLASITKLMTALVFLEQENIDWNKKMSIAWAEEAEGGRLYVAPGESVRVEDLFYSSLVASANNATLTLVRSTGLTKKDFVALMNKKAQELGMKNTYFEEPTGLSEKNVSTALDLVFLVEQSLAQSRILDTLSRSEYKFKTDQGEHSIKNTDYLIKSEYFDVTGGKTGFTDEAGYCLVTLGQVKGREIVTVVLGAENSQARFQDTKALYWWVEENFL